MEPEKRKAGRPQLGPTPRTAELRADLEPRQKAAWQAEARKQGLSVAGLLAKLADTFEASRSP